MKRSAFAIGAMFIWYIIEWVIFGLLGWKFVSWNTAQNIKNFFPLEAMSNLIKEPGTRFNAVKTVVTLINDGFTKNYDVQILDVLIVCIWTFIFIYGSFRLLKKRDL